ncbi:hypothetical protein FLACOL_02012 [Flavobacterium columnare]|uniref:Uncharacterized protein n=1 Tax=Flavobacterium columnare TaxID=996 RepID=A0A2N9PCB1_9FLAO|nr:hypothetical protein FLACOL_02012 [Flavobacterium columnare]
MFSLEKVEKVVNPPQNPVIKKYFNSVVLSVCFSK